MRESESDVVNFCIYIYPTLARKTLNAKILSLEDFSTQKYSLLKISVVMAMAMLLGLDARTRVAMGLDPNPRMGLKKSLSSASGFSSKQQDDGNKKEAISTLSSAAENSEKKERIVVKINLAA